MRAPRFPSAFVVAAFLCGAACQQDTPTAHAQAPRGDRSAETAAAVSAEKAQAIMQGADQVFLLDVRTPQEYSAGHIPGAVLIPLHELRQRLAELEAHRGKRILVYCHTQNRSGVALGFLKGQGYRASLIQGGFSGWNDGRRPVAR